MIYLPFLITLHSLWHWGFTLLLLEKSSVSVASKKFGSAGIEYSPFLWFLPLPENESTSSSVLKSIFAECRNVTLRMLNSVFYCFPCSFHQHPAVLQVLRSLSSRSGEVGMPDFVFCYVHSLYTISKRKENVFIGIFRFLNCVIFFFGGVGTFRLIVLELADGSILTSASNETFPSRQSLYHLFLIHF